MVLYAQKELDAKNLIGFRSIIDTLISEMILRSDTFCYPLGRAIGEHCSRHRMELVSDSMLLLRNQVKYLFVVAEHSPNRLETPRKVFYHYE